MPNGLKRFLQGLFVLWLLSCGCCGLGFQFIDFDETETGSSAALGGPHDLGTVVLPEGSPEVAPNRYPWRTLAVSPTDHVVGYELTPRAMSALAADHLAYARELKYQRLEGDLMIFEGPGACLQHLGCVYDRLEESNAGSVVPLATRFVEDVRSRGLSMREGAELIITFIQSLEYRLPRAEPFGILPPGMVLAQGWGDCDSKALLAVMMLEQLGVEAVVLTSAMFKHAAVGVDLPGRDQRFRGEGRTWQFVEITATGWPIGTVPPEVDMPQFWRVVPRTRGPLGG